MADTLMASVRGRRAGIGARPHFRHAGRVPDPASISPTAHYTGHVWLRNGLSHPALGTWQGRAMFTALQPTMTGLRLLGGPSLEPYLLARHRAIDAALERAIDGGIGQVLEIAGGLSPRGWRFSDRVTYVEADLPGMAARKRAALRRMGAAHRVEDLDALADGELEALAGTLDPEQGLVVITEGLIGYLETGVVRSLWARLAAILRGFSAGVYLSDLIPGTAAGNPVVVGARLALGAFVGGRVHLHFRDAADARRALLTAGFAQASVRRTTGSAVGHVLEART